VTKLSKTDLHDLLEVFFLANTPRSLFVGMNRCDAMRKLRKCQARELLEYYDNITARAERSELVVSLAYAVLCAILLRAQDGDRVAVDSTRLLWGDQIRLHLERSLVPTNTVMASHTPTTSLVSSISSPSNLPAGLVGPDGRPAASWRNE
jgi:hypothetical protein